jgi:ABC-2 type transport system ATP-binding protein
MTDSDRLSRRGVLRGIGAAGAALFAGIDPVLAAVRAQDRPDGEFSVSTTDPVEIESFDGTTIVATLYEPDTDGERAAVLTTHGWGGARADREPLARFYASHGYVVLAYDSRGFGASGGAVGVDGPNEVGDAQALLTWLADRENVRTDGEGDPRVAMDGFSYGGGIQLNTAAVDDRIDALIPRWAWHDLAYSNAPNGVLKSGWAGPLFVSGQRNGTLSEEFLRLAGPALQSGDPSEELLSYYRERSPVSKMGDITTPTLTISGWHDRLFWPNEALLNWEGIAGNDTDSRLLMYDGGHDFEGAPETEVQSEYISDAVLAWLDTYLRDGDDASDLPTVSAYRAATDSFETGDGLPLDGFETETFGLGERVDSPYFMLGHGTEHGSPTLSIEIPVESETELLGVPRLTIPATGAGGSASVFVGLERVDADGNARLLKDQVAAADVGTSGLLELDLVAIETTLAAGESLRVTLTLRDGELVDVPIPGVESDLFEESATPEYLFLAANEDATLDVPVRRA